MPIPRKKEDRLVRKSQVNAYTVAVLEFFFFVLLLFLNRLFQTQMNVPTTPHLVMQTLLVLTVSVVTCALAMKGLLEMEKNAQVGYSITLS